MVKIKRIVTSVNFEKKVIDFLCNEISHNLKIHNFSKSVNLVIKEVIDNKDINQRIIKAIIKDQRRLKYFDN